MITATLELEVLERGRSEISSLGVGFRLVLFAFRFINAQIVAENSLKGRCIY
jgi:hypothetical protein